MTFTASKIALKETGYFPQTMIDYMAGDKALDAFMVHRPQLSSFGEAMRNKSAEKTDRELLVGVLAEQLQDLELHDRVQENLQALQDENTFCVVTAHQLNLATGPLYVIYKSLSAISLCRRLEEEYPGKKLVPVFWLGSEDHDLEEIHHFNALGRTYTWNTNQTGAVGRMSTEGLDKLWESLANDAGDSIEAAAWVSMLKDCYRGGRTMTEAARDLLNRLFGSYGLVILDGDHPALKGACRDMIREDLKNSVSLDIVQQTSAKLEEKYDAQAHPREINLFFLENGMRDRIIRNSSGYELVQSGRQFTAQELEELVDTAPEHFSPNVILRPLFQQRVLPAVAYVGGGGELSYWFQLGDLFSHFGIAFPVLVLRDSVTLVDMNSCRKLDKLGMGPDEMFQDQEELIKSYITRQAGDEIDLTAEQEQMKLVFRSLTEKALRVDQTMEKAVAAEQASVMKSLEKLQQRLIKAEKQRSDVAVNQIRAVHAKMFPYGGLQERYDNYLSWYLRYGDELIPALLKVMDAPSDHMHILCEQPDT